ncbi:CDP-alcohol phosphatidyltransferase family protein [Microbacterium sp. USHLN186]|uniref:CDP-alcohol phosphatidyltransferase family protein n=1 Tax=Microbacterium sp. USHLN186 TaxID=3081286 RepID=UPI0030198A38
MGVTAERILLSGLTFSTALSSLQASQKSPVGISLYSRYINRPVGRVLAAAAAAAGLSPNAVTGVSAAMTVAGLIVLAVAPVAVGSGLVVAFCLVLGFALDSADGQVARLTGRGSPAGEWLDHVVDAGKMVAVHAAVLISAYRHELLTSGWLLVPLAYMLVVVLMFSGMTLFELLTRAIGGDPVQRSTPSAMRAVVLLFADYGILALSFTLWGLPAAFFTAYAILGSATAAITSLLFAKWFRALSRLR